MIKSCLVHWTANKKGLHNPSRYKHLQFAFERHTQHGSHRPRGNTRIDSKQTNKKKLQCPFATTPTDPVKYTLKRLTKHENPEQKPAKASNKHGLNYSARILSITHRKRANVKKHDHHGWAVRDDEFLSALQRRGCNNGRKKGKAEQEMHDMTEDTYHQKDSRDLHFKEEVGGQVG